RHSTVTVEMDAQHLGYSYNLGTKAGQVNTGVETYLFWRGGWLLQVHMVEPRQPVVLRVGGFALPLTEAHAERSDPGTMPAVWSGDGRGSVLQPLLGLGATEWDTRLDDRGERRHVAAPYHATPVARSARADSPVTLAALVWAGRDRAAAAPWRVDRATAGNWQLAHPQLGRWEISHWALPAFG